MIELLLAHKSIILTALMLIPIITILDSVVKWGLIRNKGKAWRTSKFIRRNSTKITEYYMGYAALILFSYSLYYVFSVDFALCVFLGMCILLFAEVDSILQNFFEDKGYTYSFKNLLRALRLDKFINIDALPTKIKEDEDKDNKESEEK